MNLFLKLLLFYWEYFSYVHSFKIYNLIPKKLLFKSINIQIMLIYKFNLF